MRRKAAEQHENKSLLFLTFFTTNFFLPKIMCYWLLFPVIAPLLCIVLVIYRLNQSWLYGLCQTIVAFLRSSRPPVFETLIKEEIEAADGEMYVVWWSPAILKIRSYKDQKDKGTSNQNSQPPKNVWVILPGGMTSGDSFYVWDTVISGVFGQDLWCIFHNPGIVNRCIGRSPPGLTETTYLEQFVLKQKRQGMQISLIGFSAGSMLTIAMAKWADDLEKSNFLRTLDCCVAIHGPDRIRDVFEYFNESYSRLDIPFSLSLYTTMCRSGCTRFLPLDAGGGLHNHRFAWLGGWGWMKSYTESVFRTPWAQMEAELWSCSSALAKPLRTPVMRILSLNDPLVNFSRCCDKNFFSNVDQVYIQPTAGHCCAFRYDKDLAMKVRRWRDNIINQNLNVSEP